MSDFVWASPIFFVLLIPVALLFGSLFWRQHTKRDPALQFSSLALLEGLRPSIWQRLAFLPDAFFVLALVALTLALARPQHLGAADHDDSEGIDIVVALDTSGSMLAKDFEPKDRMHVAKRSVAEFIEKRESDRIGLVVFAGEAASWLPLTLDHTLLLEQLEQVEVGILDDGTAIGSAIGTALNRLRDSRAKSRVVVLLTDGDNNSGEISPTQAAAFAKELGVQVYTILIGRGGMVPFPAGKDLFGREILQKRSLPTNPKLLEDIASRTGGKAYVAKDGEELDQSFQEVLNRLDTSRVEDTTPTRPKTELFPYFAWAGLLCLFLGAALRATRLRSFL